MRVELPFFLLDQEDKKGSFAIPAGDARLFDKTDFACIASVLSKSSYVETLPYVLATQAKTFTASSVFFVAF